MHIIFSAKWLQPMRLYDTWAILRILCNSAVIPFSVVIPLLLRQLMHCFVAICVQHWIRVITFYGVQFFAAMLSRNEFKSFHNKRTVYGSTSDSLCCCEYIDRKGKNNHLLACCCDCEALDSVCDQYERSQVLLNKNIQ